jgi:hypothetical protein
MNLTIMLQLALAPQIVSADRIAAPNFLNQLILRQRSLQSLDLITLRGQYITAALIDVLQEQDLDILGVEGLQLLWCRSGSSKLCPAKAGWWGMESCGRRYAETVRNCSRKSIGRPDNILCLSGHDFVIVFKENEI